MSWHALCHQYHMSLASVSHRYRYIFGISSASHQHLIGISSVSHQYHMRAAANIYFDICLDPTHQQWVIWSNSLLFVVSFYFLHSFLLSSIFFCWSCAISKLLLRCVPALCIYTARLHCALDLRERRSLRNGRRRRLLVFISRWERHSLGNGRRKRFLVFVCRWKRHSLGNGRRRRFLWFICRRKRPSLGNGRRRRFLVFI